MADDAAISSCHCPQKGFQSPDRKGGDILPLFIRLYGLKNDCIFAGNQV